MVMNLKSAHDILYKKEIQVKIFMSIPFCLKKL